MPVLRRRPGYPTSARLGRSEPRRLAYGSPHPSYASGGAAGLSGFVSPRGDSGLHSVADDRPSSRSTSSTFRLDHRGSDGTGHATGLSFEFTVPAMLSCQT